MFWHFRRYYIRTCFLRDDASGRMHVRRVLLFDIFLASLTLLHATPTIFISIPGGIAMAKLLQRKNLYRRSAYHFTCGCYYARALSRPLFARYRHAHRHSIYMGHDFSIRL